MAAAYILHTLEIGLDESLLQPIICLGKISKLLQISGRNVISL